MTRTNNILIVGGGAIGLAIAIELKLRGAAVTVLSRDFQQAATQAAAGMLAPQAEEITDAAMLNLCLQSQALYPDWIRKLEDISGLTAGYWPCGILAPCYQHPGEQSPNSQVAPYPSRPPRYWLDQQAMLLAQPNLGAEVMGGWWYPEDGQVDNRALAKVLYEVAQTLGVVLQEGVAVTSWQQRQNRITHLQTTDGDRQADHYVLATGAWSQALLPIPVYPKKGQMLSVKVPVGYQPELPLQRVLYGPDIYIVPRQSGQIAIGATSEAVGFTPYNTPGGIQTLLNAALRLYPVLHEFPIHECWWGFRPATPDEKPILGAGPCDNLTLAVGHYRNGILLTPITAALIANLVWDQTVDSLLSQFSWERFYPARSPLPSVGPSPALISNSRSYPTASKEFAVQTLESPTQHTQDSPLIIAGRTFHSRLMTGTGKYHNLDVMSKSITASGCQIVTVAVRRIQTKAPGHEGLAEALDWKTLWMLPNTAGCQTADEAVRVARLGREMAKLLGQEDNNFVKLEVIPDAKYLLPDPIGTLEAAEKLVSEGFAVLPYINADPLLAKRLEEVGCVTVMPLGSPIGSGQGIKNAANIQIIIENAQVPVVVDAGIGTPSEAAQAMEMGADALLINTAIAQAQDPILMAQAMGMATAAGRMAYQAGRIPVKEYANASSPSTGTIR
jgi:thiazole synthase